MKRKIKVIAEIACSHNGSIKKLKKLIDQSGRMGADIIQLQIWQLDKMMIPKNPLYKKIQKLEIPSSKWIQIIKYIKKKYKQTKIFCCFYEHHSLKILNNVKIDGIKINSSDLSNPILLKNVSQFNIPINLSVGGSSISEISEALSLLKKVNKKNITLMYGVQNFPTKLSDVNLIRINHLKQKFKLNTGYQDHSSYKTDDGIFLSSLALGYGVKYLEQHICLDHKKSTFDHQSAMIPSKFKKFLQIIDNLGLATGNKFSNKFTVAEKKYRKFQKKSIVSLQNLKKGQKVNPSHLGILRTNQIGISPSKSNKIINKILKKDKKAFEPFSFSDLR